jgi:hypothetical protein
MRGIFKSNSGLLHLELLKFLVAWNTVMPSLGADPDFLHKIMWEGSLAVPALGIVAVLMAH